MWLMAVVDHDATRFVTAAQYTMLGMISPSSPSIDSDVRLGVIGGSGLYGLDGLTDVQRHEIRTPFGEPSAPVMHGRLGEIELLFIPRHGIGHVLTPTEVPYRANIAALKTLGATHLLAISAVGSLTEALPPRSLVCPDDIIDRTIARERTFFDRGIVAHVGLAEPFSRELSVLVQAVAAEQGIDVQQGGAYVCIEGPQFSTRAESRLYRSWGAHVIGMTAMPEARLAREAELPYAMLAMVTDFDVWHETEEAVTVEMVVANLHANVDRAEAILRGLAASADRLRAVPPVRVLHEAIITRRGLISTDARERLSLIAGEHLA